MRRNVRMIFGSRTTIYGTVRSIAWNYAGYIYQIGINVGLTSYIARRLAVPEYGLLLFVMSLSATLQLLDIGIPSVLVQAYVAASLSGGKDRFNDLLGTAFVALAALGALGALILVGLSMFLPGPFNIPPQYVHNASVIFIIAGFMILAGLPSTAIENAYQASHRFDRVNQIQVTCSTLQLVLTVAVMSSGYRTMALAIVQLVATVVRVLLLIVALPSSVPSGKLCLTRFQGSLLRPLMSLGKWTLLNKVCVYGLELVVWVALGTLGSMQQAAIFGLANKLPGQLWNLVDRGGNVFLPQLSRYSAEGDRTGQAQMFLTIQKLVSGAILPFVVLGCVFARPLLQIWVGAQYASAAATMQWLLLGALAYAIAYPSLLVLYANAEIKKVTVITFWTVITSTAGCLLLVSHYGAAGLAAAMALSAILINLGWLTPTACRLTNIAPGVLIRVAVRNLGWPLVVLSTEVAFLLLLWPHLSSLWLVVSAIAVGCVYLGFWGIRTALPLYRERRFEALSQRVAGN